MSDALLADLVVALHTAYVAFVVGGMALILIGIRRQWRWVRNPWFRIAHLLAILIVVGESILGIPCPLTTWEAELRQRAGHVSNGESFIGRCLHKLLFIEAPEWLFTVGYGAFAMLVVLALWWAPPFRKPRRAP